MAAHKGEKHHKAKLNEDQVRELRRLRETEGLSYQKLCERVDWLVSLCTMERMIRRRNWKHVE